MEDVPIAVCDLANSRVSIVSSIFFAQMICVRWNHHYITIFFVGSMVISRSGDLKQRPSISGPSWLSSVQKSRRRNERNLKARPAREYGGMSLKIKGIFRFHPFSDFGDFLWGIHRANMVIGDGLHKAITISGGQGINRLPSCFSSYPQGSIHHLANQHMENMVR